MDFLRLFEVTNQTVSFWRFRLFVLNDFVARKGRRSSKDERIDAIRLLEDGYTKVHVARNFNVTESSVYGWQKSYREGGLAALSTKIASGRKRLLTDKQMLALSRYLRLSPRQLGFDFGL